MEPQVNRRERIEQHKGYDNKVLVLYIDPEDLSGTGTIYEQVVAFINANVTILTTHEKSKVNFVIGTPPDPEALAGFPYTFPFTLS